MALEEKNESACDKAPIGLVKILCLDRFCLVSMLRSLGGTGVLALSAAPFRSLGRDVAYWVLHDGNQPSRHALVVDEVGYLSHQLTIVAEFTPHGGWADWLAQDSWFRSARNIDVQLYGEAAAQEEVAAVKCIQSTQYIICLREWDGEKCLSRNAIRNIAKAAKYCAPILNNSVAGVSDYFSLVGSSDGRRAAKGQTSDRHYSNDIWGSIKDGSSRLYFARVNQKNVSAVRVSAVGDRAYYMMGGASEEGFALGASHYLLVHVATELKQLGFESLTLGVANSEGLIRFKQGLGGRAIMTKRFQLNFNNSQISVGVIGMKFRLRVQKVVAGVRAKLSQFGRGG